MTTSTTNGTPVESEAAAKRVVFATDDTPLELPAEVSRQPRDGEPRGDYLVAVAKSLGVIDHSASLTAKQKQQVAEEIIQRAAQDALFGGSRLGRAIQEADRLWRSASPTIADELGSLGARSHDLAGRSIRGPARAVALVLESLTEDPSTTLSPAEAELLRSLTPAVAEALEKRDRVLAEQLEHVLSAVNHAQLTYPAGDPGAPIVREETAA